MLASSRFVLASLLAALALTASRPAHADTPDHARAAEPAAPNEPARKVVSLELNPLSMPFGRLGAQVEWLPAAHHALVVNPHYDRFRDGDAYIRGASVVDWRGFGAEVGYRFYSGTSGPVGLYAGPSLFAGRFNAKYAPDGDVDFTSYGVAFDIGAQAMLGSGFVIGGGFGVQYLAMSKELGDSRGFATAFWGANDGIRPRLLFSVGYAF